MYKYTWQDALNDLFAYLLIMAIFITAITVAIPLLPNDQQQELPPLTNSTQCTGKSHEIRSMTMDGYTLYYKEPNICGVSYDLQSNESEQIQAIKESIDRLLIDTVTTPTVNGISIFMKQ
jgi:hypothetical protein